MTRQTCPDGAELLHFADAGLAPEQLERIEAHLRTCKACTHTMNELEQLKQDIAAPLPAAALDVHSHVTGVMARIDTAANERPKVYRRARVTGVPLAAAAALAVVALRPIGPSGSEFSARGGRSEPTLSRDIGVQLYTKQGELRPLSSGARVPRNVAFTAGLRNLAKTPAHLLLFAVDAQREVHWIAPEYTDANSNPVATVIAPSREERLLPSAVVFDDLAEGTLRIVALIAGHTMHIADVERIAKAELNDTGLMKHFPRAELRQISVQITPESKP